MPSLFGFAPGGVCPAASVAGCAVRSYRTFSPLPCEAPKSEAGRFVLCGTFPGVAPAGCYPAPHVDGARTFLSSSLSTVAGAAVRPTDVSVMEARPSGVKPVTEPDRTKMLHTEDVVALAAASPHPAPPRASFWLVSSPKRRRGEGARRRCGTYFFATFIASAGRLASRACKVSIVERSHTPSILAGRK